MSRHPHLRRYQYIKQNAKARGIPFLLTFEEWLDIWESSGYFAEMGRGAGKYCMARFGDRGPYKVGNVRIITNEENGREFVRTPAYRRRHRKAVRIAWKTPEMRANHAKSMARPEVRRKIAKGNQKLFEDPLEVGRRSTRMKKVWRRPTVATKMLAGLKKARAVLKANRSKKQRKKP